MFRWTMSLETGIEPIDRCRRHLIEAMADFFRIMDDPFLNQKMVAEQTGAIYAAMKRSFAAEDPVLSQRSDAAHIDRHAALLLAYVDLCRKVVPKIRNPKQAQQTCLEIYRVVEGGLHRHLKDEVLPYRTVGRGADRRSA
jgi:hypothetical protein